MGLWQVGCELLTCSVAAAGSASTSASSPPAAPASIVWIPVLHRHTQGTGEHTPDWVFGEPVAVGPSPNCGCGLGCFASLRDRQLDGLSRRVTTPRFAEEE